MAVTSGFFNSLYGDRKYTAEQFSALFNGLINDGVFSNIGTAFRVSATTDNNITIGIGRAWFNGIWVNNDALLPMTCNDPEVLLDRIDALVIEINRSEAVRAGRIIFVKGTASGTPVNPTLTHDAGVDQYPLAYIRRKAGVSEVVQADITNCIGTSECPYVTGILETQNIDSIVAQWESQFNLWFDGLQTELEGDVAANLASQIISLDMRFDELAKTRTVTVELEDSSLDTIEDSTGATIYGSTVLESEGSGTIVVEPTKEPEEVDGFEVGDILISARRDVGDNWLLCNGAALNRTDYEELSNVFSPIPSYSFSNTYPINNTTGDHDQSNHITDVAYGNGYLVAVGVRQRSSNEVTVIAAHRTSITSPTNNWTVVELWNGIIGQADAYKIIFVEGRFVIVGTGGYASSYSHATDARMAYTEDPSTGWTKKTLWTSSRGAMATTIAYINGKYIIGGMISASNNNTYARIAYASDITGTFTEKDVWKQENSASSFDENTIYDIIHDGSRYIFVGTSGKVDSGRRSYGRISWATDLEGDLTTIDVTSTTNSEIRSIVYHKGLYIIAGNENGPFVRYKKELSKSGWSTVSGITSAGSTGSYNYNYAKKLLVYHDSILVLWNRNRDAGGDEWIASELSCLVINPGLSISLAETIDIYRLDHYTYGVETGGMEVIEDKIVIGYGVNTYGYVNVRDASKIHLPEIECGTGAYGYIKARSE